MQRRDMVIAGGLLLGSFAIWMVGGPIFATIEELDDSGRDRYVGIAREVGAWRWSNLLFAVGTLVGLLGVVRMARAVRAADNRRLVDAAVVCGVFGAGAWCVEVAARLTISVSEARDVAAGGPTPAGLVEDVAFNWLAVALLGVTYVSFPLLALAARASGVLSRRAGLVLAVIGAVGAVAAAASSVPFLGVELAVVPLGLVLVIRGLRTRPPASVLAHAG